MVVIASGSAESLVGSSFWRLRAEGFEGDVELEVEAIGWAITFGGCGFLGRGFGSRIVEETLSSSRRSTELVLSSRVLEGMDPACLVGAASGTVL